MNSLGPRKLQARKILSTLHSEQLVLRAEDGTQLLAEWDKASEGSDHLVILLHGWEGSSKSAYQITTAAKMLDLGFDVLRVNFRDHGESHSLNRELFNSTRTQEVASALRNFLKTCNYRSTSMVGYSLGGSFTLRIAADHSKELKLSTAIAISPPVNPAHAMDALNNGFFGYQLYFYRQWRSSLKKKLFYFPDLNYQHELEKSNTVHQLNERIIPKFTPYKDTKSYFAAYALTGDRLRGLSIPTYLITAKDDPLIPVADVADIAPNPALHIEIQEYGGHCGFIEDIFANSWAERRIAEILLPRVQDLRQHIEMTDQSDRESVSAQLISS